MKAVWKCRVPNEVRLVGCGWGILPVVTAAWSWVLGHLPQPVGVELYIVCPVRGLKKGRINFEYMGVKRHCFSWTFIILHSAWCPYRLFFYHLGHRSRCLFCV